VYANGISLEHTYARALAESGIFLQQWFIYEAVGSNLVCRKVIKKLDSHRSLWASWDVATIYATMRDLRGRTSWKPNTRAKVLHFFDDPSVRIDRFEGVKTCLRRQIIYGIQKPWWIIGDGILIRSIDFYRHHSKKFLDTFFHSEILENFEAGIYRNI